MGYNSAGANGWCGVGWSLDTAYIQRETRKGVPVKWAAGAVTPSNEYDDARGFVGNVGGVAGTLILAGQTNLNPVEYRQEVETAFLKYRYYTDNHWEVVDKSGNTFYFGESSASRMENTKTGWTTGAGKSTFRWGLSRVVDINGNQTTLSYTKDGGLLYLTNICYNANLNTPTLSATHTVDFILTNRADTNITFQTGYRVETRRLLSEIQVKASGYGVRKYVLGYLTSASTRRSLLQTVTEYGADFATALPPLTFAYQVKPFEFEAQSDWTGVYSQGQTSDVWNSTRWTSSYYRMVTTMDIDGDALPDRVMRTNTYGGISDKFYVQRNTGTGFVNTNYGWAIYPAQAGVEDSPTMHYYYGNLPGVVLDLQDMNGDSLPDRVISRYPGFTSYGVSLNPGTKSPGFGSWGSSWGTVTNEYSIWEWHLLRLGSGAYSDLMDINGDGLADRVMGRPWSPFNRFNVQLNTGSGFARLVDWSPVSSQGQTDQGWNALAPVDSASCTYALLTDLNGDGLPDRVMRKLLSPYTNFVVQFNNGAGFESEEKWGPLESQGYGTSYAWNSPIASDGYAVYASLLDINGDGLPDRVMRKATLPCTNFVVQLNTGAGFAPSTNWGPVSSQGDTGQYWNAISAVQDGHSYVDLFDINGDGLPDRVMRRYTAPFDRFKVQLNKGPFPDLLNAVSNGLGGRLSVAYVPSTTWDNRHTNWVNDSWNEGAKSLLPFTVYTVREIAACDGLGDANHTLYTFKGGYFDPNKREFRGFALAEVTDPLGARSLTYSHQSGGRDDSTLGEYLDQNAIAKKGIPYRVDVIGSDTNYYKVTLNKVEETQLNGTGSYFPFISQTIVMNFEGLATYRATAKQLAYNPFTGNLTNDTSRGEVTNVVFSTHAFTDVGNDSLYTHTTWTTFANTNILNKPASLKITSDSAGNNRLRETQFSYDARGNLTTNRVWLDTAGGFITTGWTVYDQYGNPTSSTDAAGITSTTVYDSTYQQYPITQFTGTFTNQFSYDVRSGAALQAIDAKGLVASNCFDVFFRPVASYISTTAYGAPTLWRAKLEYNLGGIQNGISYNYVRKRVYDAVDLVNGHETYAYSDGLGRGIQVRTEAETGQYRVADTLYDERGNPNFQTLPRFGSGASFTFLTYYERL